MTTTADVCKAAQAALDALGDRVQALARRFPASLFTLEHVMLLWGTALGNGRHSASAAAAAANVEKVFEAAAEEARVRAAQLHAYAHILLEVVDMEGSEGEAVIATARALLAASSADLDVGLVRVAWAGPAARQALDTALRVRDGIDGAACVVGGAGTVSFLSCGDNVFTVAAADGEGAPVDSLERGDVSVCVDGGSMTALRLGEPGAVEVTYIADANRLDPITLAVHVCCTALPGSPWRVTGVLADSVLMPLVPDDVRGAFIRALATEWLPGRAVGPLLYRGSRDGMTAAAFHRHCDGRGPSLVLVRCSKGWVFGGFAGVSWMTPAWEYRGINCADVFLFSVTGPHGNVVRYPLKPGEEAEALECHAARGPVFYGGLHIASYRGDEPFNSSLSVCNVGMNYVNVLKAGKASMTGARDGKFTPVEVEIYAVRADA